MSKSRLPLSVAILGSVICLHAQSSTDVPSRGKGVTMHSPTDVIVITADEYELIDSATHVYRLTGNVRLRPATRNIIRTVTVNNGGASRFPPAKPVRLHFTGQFEISIDGALIRAEEADVDSATGDTELRGNVTIRLTTAQ